MFERGMQNQLRGEFSVMLKLYSRKWQNEVELEANGFSLFLLEDLPVKQSRPPWPRKLNRRKEKLLYKMALRNAKPSNNLFSGFEILFSLVLMKIRWFTRSEYWYTRSSLVGVPFG